MTACQARTHNNPKYSGLHGDNVATHTMYRYCPVCSFADEVMVCTEYANFLFDQVIQQPYLQVTCPSCEEVIVLEDLIDDIVPLAQEPQTAQVEYLLSGLFQEVMPCESPSHTDPNTKAFHSKGKDGNGRYYLFGSCDYCDFATTKLYCHVYTEGILTERELFPDSGMVCPKCRTQTTITQWIKSVTDRETGTTTNL